MNNRERPVPEGYGTIAQRFNVGLIDSDRSSPEGTAETTREPSAVPSGLSDGYLRLPNVETLGYCRASLRDEEQSLEALEIEPCGRPRTTLQVSCFTHHASRITFHASISKT